MIQWKSHEFQSNIINYCPSKFVSLLICIVGWGEEIFSNNSILNIKKKILFILTKNQQHQHNISLDGKSISDLCKEMQHDLSNKTTQNIRV